ncbi:MAG: phenylalanine--tRNA ligase subunit beta [Oscillospiraceae bacterium]|nr:phenylalanine--tRNA ligase subunit beta [Oscillospiraceae bacterium]
MDLSRRWLSEFVDTADIDDKTFCDELTLSGSKVETMRRGDTEIKNVVVGRILEMTRHENSDHLWVCQIDVGGEAPTQIVTGAQNQQVGDFVPVALPGAVLPGDKHIEAGKLRGVESYGMCCSWQELGMTERDWPHNPENGLFILNHDPDLTAAGLVPGADVTKVLHLDDTVVEFEITPNRPDCLSVIGLAREVSATFGRELHLHTPDVRAKAGGDIRHYARIDIADPALCPRYTGRLVKNVKIAPSPLWMRERLRAGGVRPINNIVDITNYVMLEYGQPMHAFDFSCVDGGHIIVRTARPGESIQTLDGKDHALTDRMLCICDEEKPVCVAGVMGGANSEIVGDTAMVLFESANFEGTSVRRTAMALGMRTDASSRYEKGLDPQNTIKAVQRACELVELLGAGEVVEGVIDVLPAPLKETTLPLEPEKVNALLGTDVSEAEMRRILLSLGFTLDGNMIRVPSWRADVEANCDIAEEVARFFGYNNIPTTLLRGDTTSGGYTDAQKAELALGEVCRSLGYDEIISYSFISPADYDRVRMPADDKRRDSLRILNPLGEDRSIMRTSILPSMMDILSRNYNYRNASVRLYEIGKIYLKRPDGLADEPKVLSLGAYGGGMDFFTLKGAAETLLDSMRIPQVRFTACRGNAAYHPGRCAEVWSGETRLGVLGQLHPQTAANYGMDCEVYCAELDFEAMIALRGETPIYVPLPRFPAITRDLALVCDNAVTVGELIECIRSAGAEALKGVKFFDVYTGPGIPAGKKSVAFSLTLRSDDATLTDDHAEEAVALVLKALKEKLGAVIR